MTVTGIPRNQSFVASDPLLRQKLAPPLWEVIGLLAIILLDAMMLWAERHGELNFVSPILLGIVLGAASWHMARSEPASIWTPLFSFRVAVIAFYALGSLVPYFAHEEVVERIVWLYTYSPEELSKTNFIWALFTFIVVASVKVFSTFRGRPGAEPLLRRESGMNTLPLGIGFFAAGFTVTVALSLLSMLELVSFIVPASVLLPFEAANAVGVFLIAHHAVVKRGWWYSLVAVLLIANLAAGMVLYNKSLVLFPTLLVCLAFLLERVSVARVALTTAVMVIALTILQPAIAYARDLHMSQEGQLGGGSLSQRMANSLGYWVGAEDREASSSEGLSRLSFVAIGSFLVTEYDVGLGGDTISNLGYTLIPRFLWPDKPVVSAVSSELSYRITGQDTNALAPTVAVDIYWNFGFVGIVTIAPLLALLIWIASLISVRIVASRDWLMMPFVLMAFRLGLAVDSSLVIGVAAPAVAAAIGLLLLRIAKQMLWHERVAIPEALVSPVRPFRTR